MDALRTLTGYLGIGLEAVAYVILQIVALHVMRSAWRWLAGFGLIVGAYGFADVYARLPASSESLPVFSSPLSLALIYVAILVILHAQRRSSRTTKNAKLNS
jgi:hypothetical protein